MHWQGISEFIYVAEKESFTGAARQLGVSVAHISRQINQLEQRLNIKLLYRTTRKVSLTAEGAQYYQQCRKLFDGVQQLEEQMLSLQQVPRGLIRMTAPMTYGERYVMPIVLDYMQQYPEVKVHCELTNAQLDLVDGGYDLAIRLGHLSDSSLMAKRLSSRQQFVCASPDYLAQHGTPTQLVDLAVHNCLLSHGQHWHFQVKGQHQTLKVQGNLMCSSGDSLLAAGLRGMGVMQLPNYYVSEALQSGQLVSVLDEFQEPQQGIWAVYPHNRQLSPKVRELVQLLAARLP